jgi:predicted TIM-barrel fold metal-dependent hydrolase
LTEHPKPVIDACVHHEWATQRELTDYMPRGWQEFLRQPERLLGRPEEIPILPMFPYHRAEGNVLPEATVDGQRAGTSYEVLRDQVLDPFGVDRAILSHGIGMYTPANPNPHLAREIATAANDWTLDKWVSRDERLFSLILAPTQIPDEAVAEVERLAGNPRMVGVLVAANSFAKPFGHPIYHPIYKAAAEHDLPIVFHTGGDALSGTLSATAGGGPPSTYAEYATLLPQAMMTHLITLIAQGVFVKYPNLRVLVAGAGAAWLPAIFWRFDIEYNAYRRETPWLRDTPSDVLRKHIRLTTYPLDVAPDPAQVARLLRAYPPMEDVLVYASGYPNWDADTPPGIAERIPTEWHSKVYRENALDLFRWSSRGARVEQPMADVGQMSSAGHDD